jgi:hypothetical protein
LEFFGLWRKKVLRKRMYSEECGCVYQVVSERDYLLLSVAEKKRIHHAA